MNTDKRGSKQITHRRSSALIGGPTCFFWRRYLTDAGMSIALPDIIAPALLFFSISLISGI